MKIGLNLMLGTKNGFTLFPEEIMCVLLNRIAP